MQDARERSRSAPDVEGWVCGVAPRTDPVFHVSNAAAAAMRRREDAAFWERALAELEKAADGGRMNASVAAILADRIRAGLHGYLPISWAGWLFEPRRDAGGGWRVFGPPPGFTDTTAAPPRVRAVAYRLGVEQWGLDDPQPVKRMCRYLGIERRQWHNLARDARAEAERFLDETLYGCRAGGGGPATFVRTVGEPGSWRALLRALEIEGVEDPPL